MSETIAFIWELLEFISTAGGIMPKYKAYRGRLSVKQSTFYGSLYRLEQKGLVKRKKQKDKIFYSITEEGRALLFKPSLKIVRSDGFSTLITFDIPEAKRRERNLFRRYLQRNGYTLIQKSLLVSPNKIDKDILDLMVELKIKPHVKIVSGKFDYI